MRNTQFRPEPHKQRILRNDGTIENARKLLAERHALDAVEMQHRGMRREAREDRRTSIYRRPIDDSRETGPIGLVRERGGLRLAAGDDEPIELFVPERADIAVMRRNMLRGTLATRNPVKRIKTQTHGQRAGGLDDQILELAFRRQQRGVGHVVDDADLKIFRRRRTFGIARS